MNDAVGRWSARAAFGLALAGAIFCVLLLRLHAGGVGSGFLSRVCGGEGGGCDRAIQSRWAVIPPRPVESASDVEGGIPVAFLGFLYFSSLAVWFGLVGRPGPERRWLRKGTVLVVAAGTAVSAGFIGIMAVEVGISCSLCLGSHLANFMILPATVLARPRRADAAPFPDGRLAAAVAALCIAIGVAGWQSYRATRLGAENAELRSAMAEWTEDGELVELSHLSRKPLMVSIREGENDPRLRDPMIEVSPGPCMTVVYFSDVECAHCATFEKMLFEQVRPVFHGHLRIVFKHFPLTDKHPNALRAATALEAARMQGRFWDMHDYLVARRAELRSVSYADAARTLGLDPAAFARDMEAPETTARIQEDMRLALELGVTTTPWVFLECRLVDRRMLRAAGFWKLRANALRREYDLRRMVW